MRDMLKLIDENPALNEMVAMQQRGTLEYLYGDLIRRFNLGPEEKDYFLDLLLARQMQQVSLAMAAMGGDVPREEQEASLQALKETRELVRAEMKNFLNSDDDFEAYTHYEDTLNIRMEVSGFAKATAQLGEPLDPGAQDQIVDLIHRERQGYPFSQPLSRGGDDVDLSGITDEAIRRHIDETTQFNEHVASLVTALLSPAQLEAFVRNQEQMLNLQATGLRMAAKMFGGAEPADATEAAPEP